MTEYLQISDQKATIVLPQIDEINALVKAVGWKERDPSVWQKTLAVSSYVAYARDATGRLIGLGRILEDGAVCMFFDVAVHPDHQHQGIGTQMMEELIAKIKSAGYVFTGLFCEENNPTVAAFYERVGFKKVATGMELRS